MRAARRQGRRQLERAREARRAGEAGADYKKVRRGWCLGTETFRKELLGQLKERLGAEHYRAKRQEMVAAHAEGLVRAELKRRHWPEADWAHRPKGDARKVALAVRLRAETTVTVRWIAERLHMGAPGYVHHLLYLERNAKGK